MKRRDAVSVVFVLGVLLRLPVFWFMRPVDNDDHYVVIRHILEHHELVPSDVYEHSFHPQLYHVLAVPFVWAGGGAKAAQVLSLILSLATLDVLRRLVRERRLFPTPLQAAAGLSLAAFVPSFVTFGLYVSNDTLAIFLGSLLALRAWRLLTAFSLRNLFVCAVLLGLGLSAKHTFLALVPPTAALLAFVLWRSGLPRAAALGWLLLAGLVAGGLGAQKFIDNEIRFGHLLVHNLDRRPLWALSQRPTYVGLRSLVDVDLRKLLRYPVVQDATRHSWPLMMYGTFWYKYWNTENNFVGYKTRWIYLGSALYLAGLLPTLGIAWGLLLMLFGGIPRGTPPTAPDWDARRFAWFSVSSVFLSVLLVLVAGAKYDVCSCFQSRLFFAAFFGLVLAAGDGLRGSGSGTARGLRRALAGSYGVVSAVSVFYFCVECALIYRS